MEENLKKANVLSNSWTKVSEFCRNMNSFNNFITCKDGFKIAQLKLFGKAMENNLIRKQFLKKAISPMLATLGQMPYEPKKFAFEFKWDGYRALCLWDRKELVFHTRNHIDITYECEPLVRLRPSLGRESLLLDGEIIAADAAGNSNFAMLQEHFGFRSKTRRNSNLAYVIFDILYFKDQFVTSYSFQQRRELLEKLSLKNNPRWKLSPCEIGDGSEMLKVVKKKSLEGLIAKRLESIYIPGRRSEDWVKIKFAMEQEFVVAGWMLPKKGDEAGIGSLMLGYYDSVKKLHYAGNVGTGFNQEERVRLKNFLVKQKLFENPFTTENDIPRGAQFSKPLMVAQIEFRGWTRDGKLRQASFKGLRIDKNPKEVRVETKRIS